MIDKLKELREWGTFWLSLLTVICIPVGILILRNQRLEIERGVSDIYVTKAVWQEEKASAERHQTEVGQKLDTILAEQIRQQSIIGSLRESIAKK